MTKADLRELRILLWLLVTVRRYAVMRPMTRDALTSMADALARLIRQATDKAA